MVELSSELPSERAVRRAGVTEVAGRVLSRVRAAVAVNGAPAGRDLDLLVREAAAGCGLLLGSQDVDAVVERVRAELWGFGSLDPLVRPGVTDILVNSADEVWLDDGAGLRRVPSPLSGEAELRSLAVRLAAGAGRRLDDASPCVDARLRDGVRLHAVLPPISPVGTVLSLRLLRSTPFDLGELVRAGALPEPWVPVLAAVVACRVAFLVSGGTGAGKTTLLAALLGLTPPGERIVLVEDVGELRPKHPHVVRLEARHENVEGRGAVTLDDLVRQALRMRPDRLVVGECRGAEVRDLLTALNTGHSGGCGTVHANAAADVPARLEALGALAGMTGPAVRAQVAAGLELIVHLERDGGFRRVAEIGLIETVGAGREDVRVTPALISLPAGSRGPGSARLGPAWPELARRLAWAGPAPASP
jgi:pilus assembly protein CpaF